jgi:hypothetical protein
MDVNPAFVADCEAAEAVQPGEAAFDNPAVASQFLACLDAASGNARLYATSDAGASASPVIVGFVGVQLVRPSTWSATRAPDRRNAVEQLFQWHAVMDVSSGQQKGERNTSSIGNQVTFSARSTSIRGVRADLGTPFLAAMEQLSMQSRLQSMRSACRRRRSNSRCRPSHTPACCQSRSRRQHVTPEPHPISCGSISHGIPVRRTNRMPVNAMRLPTQGRPPLSFAASTGSRGSMIDQSASDTRGTGIPPHESDRTRVQGF